MTIQEKLYNYYKEVIEEINNTPVYKTNFNSLRKFLRQKKLHYGVCYCADNIFDEYLYSDEPKNNWVNKYKGIEEDDYWYKPPAFSESIQEIMDSLTIRLNNLKKKVESIKQNNS